MSLHPRSAADFAAAVEALDALRAKVAPLSSRNEGINYIASENAGLRFACLGVYVTAEHEAEVAAIALSEARRLRATFVLRPDYIKAGEARIEVEVSTKLDTPCRRCQPAREVAP